MSDVRLILIAAPSGAGKNSFMSRALADFPRLFDVVTYTTRERREGEEHGVDYHFIEKSSFEDLVEKGFFVEWSPVHDSFYGTSRQSLEETWQAGRVAIMDIDVQGVEKFTKIYTDAISIFILPPSIEELKRRILSRDKKAPANLELRLANAEKEIQLAHRYDYQIVNDDFEASYGRFKKILEELL
ncbi:MAG: guanylate kinase [Pseudomonadota bacterium]